MKTYNDINTEIMHQIISYNSKNLNNPTKLFMSLDLLQIICDYFESNSLLRDDKSFQYKQGTSTKSYKGLQIYTVLEQGQICVA